MAEQSVDQTSLLTEGVSPFNAAGLFDVVVGLAFIVCLIFALAFLFKKFGSGSIGMGCLIRVIAAMSLGGRDRIALISVGEKQLLLGISPGRIATLHVFDEEITGLSQPGFSKSSSQASGDFATKLHKLIAGQKS